MCVLPDAAPIHPQFLLVLFARHGGPEAPFEAGAVRAGGARAPSQGTLMAVDFLTAQRHSSPQFRCDEREDVLIRLHPARNANIVRIPLERGRVAHSIYGSRARTRATGKGVLLYVTAAHKVRHPGSLAGGHVCRPCSIRVTGLVRGHGTAFLFDVYTRDTTRRRYPGLGPAGRRPGAHAFPFPRGRTQEPGARPRHGPRAPAVHAAPAPGTAYTGECRRTSGSAPHQILISIVCARGTRHETDNLSCNAAASKEALVRSLTHKRRRAVSAVALPAPLGTRRLQRRERECAVDDSEGSAGEQVR